MRMLAWLPVAALVTLLAGCGDIPQTFTDAAGGGGSCTPACAASATCTGTTCACNAGYTGDGLTCTDDNECMTGNGGCDSNATCTNVPGTRTCSCLPGFLGDGVTCRQSWMLVGTLPGTNLDPERFGSKAAAVGTRIFFGPEVSSAATSYMRSFDTQTNTFGGPHALPPAASSDFVAAGYTDAFISDGAGIFMLGNAGFRYDPGADRWAQIGSYVDPHRRGEAAGSFDANNGLLLLIGGRSNETTAIHMTVPGGVFGPEAGTLPAQMSSASAFTPAGGNVTYVAGGDFANRRALMSHATGSGAWTLLDPAPGDLSRPVGMGTFMGKLWVANGNDELFFYNPTSSTWRPTSVPTPTGLVRAVTAAMGTYAFVQNGTALEVHKLVNIE